MTSSINSTSYTINVSTEKDSLTALVTPHTIGGVDGQLYNKSNLSLTSTNDTMNQTEGKEVQVFYYQPAKKKPSIFGSLFGSMSPSRNKIPSFADKLDATIATSPQGGTDISSGPPSTTASGKLLGRTSQGRDLSTLARIGLQFSQVIMIMAMQSDELR